MLPYISNPKLSTLAPHSWKDSLQDSLPYLQVPLQLRPSYLPDLLSHFSPARTLRSSDKLLLTVPHYNLKSYGARTFSYAAASLWNSLPIELKTSPPLSTFKPNLKTHFFLKYRWILLLFKHLVVHSFKWLTKRFEHVMWIKRYINRLLLLNDAGLKVASKSLSNAT